MASNLRVDTILPSTGLTLGIGTASGTINFLGNSNIVTTGNVSIGGTLTYEDVTNVDSVGVITARSTVSIADSIVHTGDTNTSLRFPAANTITAETGGLERLRIDSSGHITQGGGAAPSSTNGNVGLKFGIKSTANNVIIGETTQSGNGYGLQIESRQTGRSGNARIAQIGLKNDSSGNGQISFFTSASGADVTERMVINSSGYVTKPSQFHIVVVRDSNQTGYNPSQNFGTGVIFNHVEIVQGTTSSALDTSNGRITVPVDGIYFLEGSSYSSTQAFTQGWFTKNGSRLAYSDFMDNSGLSQNVNSNGFHKLAANDAIGFKPYGSQHTSVTVQSNAYHTWMRITLVG